MVRLMITQLQGERLYSKMLSEMYHRYKDRMPYNLWHDAVFKDYCDFGVLPATAGGVNLACPPHVEASIYMANFESNLHDLIPSISTPTVILRAAPRDEVGKINFASSGHGRIWLNSSLTGMT